MAKIFFPVRRKLTISFNQNNQNKIFLFSKIYALYLPMCPLQAAAPQPHDTADQADRPARGGDILTDMGSDLEPKKSNVLYSL